MSYETKPAEIERIQAGVFYDQIERLAKAGASFEKTKTYLQSHGLSIEPVMTTERTKVKLVGIDGIPETEESESIEHKLDSNTVTATGTVMFGSVPVMLMVSYGSVPLEAMPDGHMKYRGLFNAAPHVAVSGFVGDAFYQNNWVVSDEVEKAVEARKSRLRSRPIISETAMRV
jgi:hypothetical protein